MRLDEQLAQDVIKVFSENFDHENESLCEELKAKGLPPHPHTLVYAELLHRRLFGERVVKSNLDKAE